MPVLITDEQIGLPDLLQSVTQIRLGHLSARCLPHPLAEPRGMPATIGKQNGLVCRRLNDRIQEAVVLCALLTEQKRLGR